MFTEKELAYLRSQPLIRIGTVSVDGQPNVDSVGFEFDGTHFYIGGIRFDKSRKYKNVEAGNTKVSLIVDDLASTQPWTPRGIRIDGVAEIVQRQEQSGPAPAFAIKPVTSWSWGIEGSTFTNGKFTPHKTTWS